MGLLDWVDFNKGRARFAGSIRGADDRGHDLIAAQIGNGHIFFGDFRLTAASDRDHFNIEIVSFGYRLIIFVGQLTLRTAISRAELNLFESLIRGLFHQDREMPFPLHEKWRFAGEVAFRGGWIRLY